MQRAHDVTGRTSGMHSGYNSSNVGVEDLIALVLSSEDEEPSTSSSAEQQRSSSGPLPRAPSPSSSVPQPSSTNGRSNSPGPSRPTGSGSLEMPNAIRPNSRKRSPSDYELHDLWDCAICFEPILTKRPRRLKCDHTFCTPCLQSLQVEVVNNKNTISCPKCRKKIPLSRKGVESFPINCDLGKIHEEINSALVTCTMCYSKSRTLSTPTHICTSCPDALKLCEDCAIRHRSLPFYKDHALIALDNTRKRGYCKEHQVGVTCVCLVCCKALCVHCVEDGNTHADHQEKIVEFCVALKQYKANGSVLQERVEKARKNTQSVSQTLEKDHQVIQNVIQKYTERLEELNHSQSLIEKFQNSIGKIQNLLDFQRDWVTFDENQDDETILKHMEMFNRGSKLGHVGGVLNYIEGGHLSMTYKMITDGELRIPPMYDKCLMDSRWMASTEKAIKRATSSVRDTNSDPEENSDSDTENMYSAELINDMRVNVSRKKGDDSHVVKEDGSYMSPPADSSQDIQFAGNTLPTVRTRSHNFHTLPYFSAVIPASNNSVIFVGGREDNGVLYDIISGEEKVIPVPGNVLGFEKTSGSIFIVEEESGRASVIESFTGEHRGEFTLDFPSGCKHCLYPEEHRYLVVKTEAGRIYESLFREGKGSPSIVVEGLKEPKDLVCSRVHDKFVYAIIEQGRKQVKVYNDTWQQTVVITSFGDVDFVKPTGIAMIHDGIILIADQELERIGVFHTTGKFCGFFKPQASKGWPIKPVSLCHTGRHLVVVKASQDGVTNEVCIYPADADEFCRCL